MACQIDQSTIARTRDPRPRYLHFNSRFADLSRKKRAGSSNWDIH
jgi:hypothetical protein